MLGELLVTGAGRGSAVGSSGSRSSATQHAASPTRADTDIQSARRTELRQVQLRQVHRAMDSDQSGYIEAPELLLLGRARRATGQRSGEWTEAMNSRMMDQMDTTRDAKINADEFADFFEQRLGDESWQFEESIQQFMEVAAKCKKQQQPHADSSKRKTARPKPKAAQEEAAQEEVAQVEVAQEEVAHS